MQIWHLRNIYLEESKINVLTFIHNAHEIRFSIDHLYCQCVKVDLKMQKHLDVNANHVNHVKSVDRYSDVRPMIAKLKNAFFRINESFLLWMYPVLSNLMDKVCELRYSNIFLIYKYIQKEMYKWSKRKKRTKLLAPVLHIYLFIYLLLAQANHSISLSSCVSICV